MSVRSSSGIKQKRELVQLMETIVDSPDRARALARFIEDRANGIVATTRRQLNTVLSGVNRGDIQGGVNEIRKLYRTEFVAKRSNRIALNQTLSTSIQIEADLVDTLSTQTGKQYDKTWLTQGDDNVRESHERVHGRKIAKEDYFQLDGGALFLPRDVGGPQSETIGCRCWVEFTQRRT